jgi:hypothetical protein
MRNRAFFYLEATMICSKKKVITTDGSVLGEHIWVWCPGCGEAHTVWISHTKNDGPVWTWNGSLDKPTFSPSLRVNWGDGRLCHSFIRDGQWQFLGDCTHALAGKTVPMPELPEWLE